MQFACPSCATPYWIADEELLYEVIRVRCRQCGQINTVGEDAVVRDSGGPERPAAAVWFVIINRQQVGPLTVDELSEKIRFGDVDAESYGWREGMAEWCKLSTLAELRPLFGPGRTGSLPGPAPGPSPAEPMQASLGRPRISHGLAAASIGPDSPLLFRPSVWEVQVSLPRILAPKSEPPPPVGDPVEEAFSTLERGWFSVDAPAAMLVGVATKISAGAIRKEIHRQLLAATLEHDQAQLVLAQLGKLVRVELVPDSEEDFGVRALSAIEQPVLQSEVTRWEWLVTPKTPGDDKILRVVATNLVDVGGQRLSKSHPVKTLTVRVQVRASGPDARPISTAALRRALDQTLRVDADLEAFCLDYFPSVFVRFGRGMDRQEKTTLLLSQADGAAILDSLYLHSPEAAQLVMEEPAPAAPPSTASEAAAVPGAPAAALSPPVLARRIEASTEEPLRSAAVGPSPAARPSEPEPTTPPLADWAPPVEPQANPAPVRVVIRIPLALIVGVLLLGLLLVFLLRGSR